MNRRMRRLRRLVGEIERRKRRHIRLPREFFDVTATALLIQPKPLLSVLKVLINGAELPMRVTSFSYAETVSAKAPPLGRLASRCEWHGTVKINLAEET